MPAVTQNAWVTTFGMIGMESAGWGETAVKRDQCQLHPGLWVQARPGLRATLDNIIHLHQEIILIDKKIFRPQLLTEAETKLPQL